MELRSELEKLLTVPEAADFLHVHPQTLYKDRKIPRLKIPGVGILSKIYSLKGFLKMMFYLTNSPNPQIHIKDDQPRYGQTGGIR